MKPTFGETIGGAMALVVTGVLSYSVVVQGNADALMALVALLGAASGYFLRAKITPPRP